VNLTNRRVFMMTLAAGTSALASSAALAQAKLDEKDPQAVALGYVADTTKADTKKFPKHSKDQMCSNCQLFTGKPKEPTGPCALFPGKAVAAGGWCSAWVKKA
jgi:High potential iron-sulfur protein